jgi:hypothetical protein
LTTTRRRGTAPRQAETAIKIVSNLIDLARIENGVPLDKPKQKICFDEWNVWDPIKAPGSQRDMYADKKRTARIEIDTLLMLC